MRYLHVRPHNSGYGCDTSMYPNLLYNMIWDMIPTSIAICYAISHRITARHQENTTSTKTDHLVAAYVLLWLLVSAFLALSPAWPFLSSFCCPPDRYIIGQTVPPANTNIVPSRLALLPECMIVFIPFVLFSLIPSLYPSCYIYIYRMVSASRYPQKCSRY